MAIKSKILRKSSICFCLTFAKESFLACLRWHHFITFIAHKSLKAVVLHLNNIFVFFFLSFFLYPLFPSLSFLSSLKKEGKEHLVRIK